MQLTTLRLTIIFLLALGIRIWFNFFFAHVNNYSSCDASEYIRNADALLTLLKQPSSFWLTCLHCLFGFCRQPEIIYIKHVLACLSDFSISGPIFPCYIAICNHLNFFQLSWSKLLFVQSFISALTAVLIGVVGIYSFGKKEGICAALIAAVYPGFIINSGRLYSETFACFLLSSILALLVIGFKSYPGYLAGFFTGVLSACLQFTRSTMCVLSLVLLPFIWWQNKNQKPWLSLTLFIVGFAVVALPWIALQKLAFGSYGLVVDRVGHYNCFVGNNIDTSGWLSLPYPDGRGIENKSFPALIMDNVKKSPMRWGKLFIDKPARLFKQSWNDFKTSIGPIEPIYQNSFHQIIVLLAILGIILGLTVNCGQELSKAQITARFFLFGMLAFHCIYWLFITVPRYNLTAIPEIILFASSGLITIFTLLKKAESRLIALALIVTTALLFLFEKINLVAFLIELTGNQSNLALLMQSAILLLTTIAIGFYLWKSLSFMRGNIKIARVFLVLLTALLMLPLSYPARATGRWWEWHTRLSKEQSISQNLLIDNKLCPNLLSRQAYLLLDLNGVEDSKGLNVYVNGHLLSGPIIPSISLIDQTSRVIHTGSCACQFQHEGGYIYNCLSIAAGKSNADLRQWFLIPVPQSVMEEAVSKSTEGNNKFLVKLERVADGASKIFGKYSIAKDYSVIPSLSFCSWEKAFYGVEDDHGLSDSRYDIKTNTVASEVYSHDLSTELGKQTGSFNIHILVAPETKIVSSKQNKLLTLHHKDPVSLQLPTAMQKFIMFDNKSNIDSNNLCFLQIKGRAKKESGAYDPYFEFRGNYLDGKEETVYLSSWTPNSISLNNEWRNFDIALPFSPAQMKGKLQNIQIRFCAIGPFDILLNTSDFSSAEPKFKSIQFSDIQVNVFPVAINPLLPGHQVF